MKKFTKSKAKVIALNCLHGGGTFEDADVCCWLDDFWAELELTDEEKQMVIEELGELRRKIREQLNNLKARHFPNGYDRKDW